VAIWLLCVLGIGDHNGEPHDDYFQTTQMDMTQFLFRCVVAGALSWLPFSLTAAQDYEFGICKIGTNCQECIESSQFEVTFIVDSEALSVRLVGRARKTNRELNQLLDGCEFSSSKTDWVCHDGRTQYQAISGMIYAKLTPNEEIKLGDESYHACLNSR